MAGKDHGHSHGAGGSHVHFSDPLGSATQFTHRLGCLFVILFLFAAWYAGSVSMPTLSGPLAPSYDSLPRNVMKERYETQLADMERQMSLYRQRLVQLEGLLKQHAPLVDIPRDTLAPPTLKATGAAPTLTPSAPSVPVPAPAPVTTSRPADLDVLQRLPSRQTAKDDVDG